MTWDDLKFWDTGEWQAIEERLDDLEKKGVKFNPNRENLFAALDLVDFNSVRVAILGQDPYPQHEFATGVAFSIPSGGKKLPPTLVNIFKEYVDDLHYDWPASGDLSSWCNQGVLLWNCIPTCEAGKPATHRRWEWNYLTKEIVNELSKKGIVFVLLGGLAREYIDHIDQSRNCVLSYSHPSPLGVNSGRRPFHGSRLFSTINAKLVERKEQPVDWKLDA